jgi:transmembrane 9 superfamily protein 2/4
MMLSISRWCRLSPLALLSLVLLVSSRAEEEAVEDKKEVRAQKVRERRKRFFRKKEKSLASILFPGVAPEDYIKDEEMPVWVELVESKKTQVPFEYYDLPVCPGPSIKKSQRLRKNLGAKLQGYNIKPSPYEVRVLRSTNCQPICQVKIQKKAARWMRQLITRQYRVHMSMDSLPLLMRNSELKYTVRGYPVGFKTPGSGGADPEIYLYNHLRFTISYHKDAEQYDGVRIVGFDVHPVSIKHEIPEGGLHADTVLKTCNPNDDTKVINDPQSYLSLPMSEEEISVVYSYEVEWVESSIAWSDRWDVYFAGSPEDDVHYFAIINSLMIVIFLTGAIATVMLRILKKDISSYNEIASLEEGEDEGVTGWKLVHGDVFRVPKGNTMLLSVAVGTGAQLGIAMVLTIVSALMGMLNPMKKGQTLTSIVLLYVLSGSVAGYVSSRLYKFFDAKAWKRNTLLTATAFPGVLVTMFICLNVFLAIAGAATAVSIWTILAIFLLWVCVSTPLVFVGSYFGYRAEKIEVPTKTNQIARFIPEVPWYSKLPYSMVLGGILPFGSVCIEMFFIMGALWLHQIYYVMGFLFAVVAILGLSCSEVAIIMCYSQLSAEDHQWWWRSFLNTGATGIYIFIYALWFLSSKLDLVGVLPTLVYLTYMSMFSMAVGLFCGSVGFLATLKFNKMIYGALKVD